MTHSYKHCSDGAPCLFCRVRAAGYPTSGELAVELWERLSGPYHYDGPSAARIYRELGYSPFEGYPLKHAFNAFAH